MIERSYQFAMPRKGGQRLQAHILHLAEVHPDARSGSEPCSALHRTLLDLALAVFIVSWQMHGGQGLAKGGQESEHCVCAQPRRVRCSSSSSLRPSLLLRTAPLSSVVVDDQRSQVPLRQDDAGLAIETPTRH